MYRNIEGQIVYTARDCGVGCTGQRDRLWSGGLTILRENWLFGVGLVGWPGAFLASAGFPFDSPHDALIEIWGGHGIAGLLVYLAFAYLLLRTCLAAPSPRLDGSEAVFAEAVRLFALTIFLSEFVDPVKFLAANPHAVWLWVLLAALPKEPLPTLAPGRPES
jgi:O-antigen ligase